MTATDPARRSEELARNLATVEGRIAGACAAAGRPPGEVTLVVVTKNFPASDVRLLRGLGVTQVAENRHQEAVAKRQECRDLDLTWHFVGHLQSNKATAVGGWADVVQSVDRVRLLDGLIRAARQRDRALDVLLQVNLDPPDQYGGRSGAAPEQTAALAREVLARGGLSLRGVMAVAPRAEDPASAFARLAAVASEVRAVCAGASWVSAGMSGDLEAAVAAGATHARVGSAVLGNRPPPG